eukprot:SAG31_NODE_2115_length_6416_cov_20.056989_7_plen_108_part_00
MAVAVYICSICLFVCLFFLKKTKIQPVTFSARGARPPARPHRDRPAGASHVATSSFPTRRRAGWNPPSTNGLAARLHVCASVMVDGGRGGRGRRGGAAAAVVGNNHV